METKVATVRCGFGSLAYSLGLTCALRYWASGSFRSASVCTWQSPRHSSLTCPFRTQRYWRMIALWTAFTGVSAALLYKAKRRPLDRTTPRYGTYAAPARGSHRIQNDLHLVLLAILGVVCHGSGRLCAPPVGHLCHRSCARLPLGGLLGLASPLLRTLFWCPRQRLRGTLY